MIATERGDGGFEDLGLTQIRISLDALTVSLTESEVSEMFGKMIEAVRRTGCNTLPTMGRPWRDFRKTQRYGLSTLNEGAQWYRKYDPQQLAPTLGSDYESWEVMGPAARILADVLKSAPVHVGRASRLDVAFDFACEPDLWPAAIEDAISFHCEHHGFHIHYQGEREKRTVYVGSPKSERRVRIYRHDLAHGGGLPILRVEVELRRKHAAEAWRRWWPGGGPAIGLCAGHIEQMTGRAVFVDELTYPAPAPGRDVDLIETSAHGTTQYGGAFEALLRAGVDLTALVRDVRELQLSASGKRVREHKMRRLLASVRGLTPEQIASAILGSIRARIRQRLPSNPTGPSVRPGDPA
ncbi:MAG: hypothetical protein ACE37K_06305 [Planctomycetota bacterium]